MKFGIISSEKGVHTFPFRNDGLLLVNLEASVCHLRFDCRKMVTYLSNDSSFPSVYSNKFPSTVLFKN